MGISARWRAYDRTEKTIQNEALKFEQPKNEALAIIKDKLEIDNLTKEQKNIVMARVQENTQRSKQLNNKENLKQKEIEQERYKIR